MDGLPSLRRLGQPGYPMRADEADCKTPMAQIQPRFFDVGDTAISVEFGTDITVAANDAVVALDNAVTAAEIEGVVETVPSFRSLLVIYEPELIGRAKLTKQIRALLAQASNAWVSPGRRWSIPVTYEQPFGEDLAEVADLLGLSQQDVVAAHTGAELRVYMLGFQPGLPNLGGLPECLHVSRRVTPRAPVPGGSCMIGGIQGAIMPRPTPSGFYLLGRTPVRLFDTRRPERVLLRAGDVIRFRAISCDEYARLDELAEITDPDAGAVLEPTVDDC